MDDSNSVILPEKSWKSFFPVLHQETESWNKKCRILILDIWHALRSSCSVVPSLPLNSASYMTFVWINQFLCSFYYKKMKASPRIYYNRSSSKSRRGEIGYRTDKRFGKINFEVKLWSSLIKFPFASLEGSTKPSQLSENKELI